MSLNNSENRIVEEIVHLLDITSRVVVSAEPGSRYMWDKGHQLERAAKRLTERLGGEQYQPLPDPIDPAKVAAAVAEESRHYAIGKALYESQT